MDHILSFPYYLWSEADEADADMAKVLRLKVEEKGLLADHLGQCILDLATVVRKQVWTRRRANGLRLRVCVCVRLCCLSLHPHSLPPPRSPNTHTRAHIQAVAAGKARSAEGDAGEDLVESSSWQQLTNERGKGSYGELHVSLNFELAGARWWGWLSRTCWRAGCALVIMLWGACQCCTHREGAPPSPLPPSRARST